MRKKRMHVYVVRHANGPYLLNRSEWGITPNAIVSLNRLIKSYQLYVWYSLHNMTCKYCEKERTHVGFNPLSSLSFLSCSLKCQVCY